MVRIVLIISFLFLIGLPSFGASTKVTPEGVYMDCRDQMSFNTIDPPYKENIPEEPHPIETIVPYDTYYKVEYENYQRPAWREPLIYDYNAHASTRHGYSYTKQEYVDVWCTGTQYVGKVDCLTDEYAISFFPVRSWFRGITTAVVRGRKFKQEGAVFLYVESVGGETEYITQAKQWADLWGIKVFFGTIDSEIPLDWIQYE